MPAKCQLRNIEDLLVIRATQELGNDYAVKLEQRTMEAWEPLQAPLVPP